MHTYHSSEMTYKKTFGGCNLAGALQNLAKCFLAPVISASIQRQPFRDKDSFEMWQLCATRWGLGNLNNAIVKKPWTSVNIFALHTLYVSFMLTTFEGLAFGR